jgi:hypothetical protein
MWRGQEGSSAGWHLVDRDKGGITERADDTCATGRPVLHLKGSTNHAGTVVHDAQPHTTTCGYVSGKTYSIIVHHECHMALPRRERDHDLLSFAMLNGIVDSFLHDAIQVHRHGKVGNVDSMMTADLAGAVK